MKLETISVGGVLILLRFGGGGERERGREVYGEKLDFETLSFFSSSIINLFYFFFIYFFPPFFPYSVYCTIYIGYTLYHAFKINLGSLVCVPKKKQKKT